VIIVTDTIRLTEAQVRQHLTDLANERPDYVYHNDPANHDELGASALVKCLYQRDGEPSCIVGHVVHRVHGYVPTDWDYLRRSDLLDAGSGGQSELIADIIERGYLEVDTPRAASLLIHAQAAQDDSNTWGKSVAIAFQEAE
jgi:hypothetical protein